MTIRGVVGDSVRGWPISDASIFLDDASDSTATDFSGSFVLSGVTGGSHVLIVTALGFQTQRYEMAVSLDLGLDQDIGLIVLRPLPPVTVRLSGIVRPTAGSERIDGAEITLAATTKTTADARGRFETDDVSLQPGYYMALVRAVGYRPAPFQVTVTEGGDIFVTVMLERIDRESLSDVNSHE